MKACFTRNYNGKSYVCKIQGVEYEYFKLPFGRQLEYLRLIKDFKTKAKSVAVYAKNRATLTAVRSWIKDNKPNQFFASWIADSEYYKDDIVELFYI